IEVLRPLSASSQERRFIPGCAWLSESLTNLLLKEVTFLWSKPQQVAFDELQRLLTQWELMLAEFKLTIWPGKGWSNDLTDHSTMATPCITDHRDQLTSATPHITNFQSTHNSMSQNGLKIHWTIDHPLSHPLDGQLPQTCCIILYHHKDEDALFRRTAMSSADQFCPTSNQEIIDHVRKYHNDLQYSYKT
uniref:Uncharacterized protein n=1 Tax=Romanomermis culicivorax TaxID=13658 RepID=A0A915JI63_ROMCU